MTSSRIPRISNLSGNSLDERLPDQPVGRTSQGYHQTSPTSSYSRRKQIVSRTRYYTFQVSYATSLCHSMKFLTSKQRILDFLKSMLLGHYEKAIGTSTLEELLVFLDGIVSPPSFAEAARGLKISTEALVRSHYTTKQIRAY